MAEQAPESKFVPHLHAEKLQTLEGSLPLYLRFKLAGRD
jgi:hypothetical protein